MTDLVLSIGAGYPDAVSERYLSSLRATGYGGQVAILIKEADLTPEKRALFEYFQAQAVTYPESRFIEVSLRFPLYLQLLEQLRVQCQSGRVLHTDLRDVIFQSDPFKHPLADKADLLLAIEAGKIGECRFNTEWIRGGFGEEILQRIASQPISCAGTTMGSFDAMRYYFSRISELVFSRTDPAGITSDTLNDQGVHNYLLHQEGFGAFSHQALDNNSGLFLTVGLLRETNINAKGQLVCEDGRVSSIVHQLDRLPPSALAELREVLPYSVDDLLRKSVENEILGGAKNSMEVRYGVSP